MRDLNKPEMVASCSLVSVAERARAAGFTEWLIESVATFAESEAALARNQERMEIAKLLCSECAKGDKPERFSNKELGIHEWVHTMLGFDDRNENCSADAIHERNLAETGG